MAVLLYDPVSMYLVYIQTSIQIRVSHSFFLGTVNSLFISTSFIKWKLFSNQGRSQEFQGAEEDCQKKGTKFYEDPMNGVRVEIILKFIFKNASKIAYFALILVEKLIK